MEYKNPIRFQEAAGEYRDEVRDPCVIRDGNKYYLIHTMYPFTHSTSRDSLKKDYNSSPGIRMYESDDLVNWRVASTAMGDGWLVKSSALPDTCPYKHRFWAPEIHKIRNRVYLVFTASNWIKNAYNPTGDMNALNAFIGVSDKITGPYEHITFIPGGACDLTIMDDEQSGKTYAYIPAMDVFVQEIDLDHIDEGKVALVGPKKKVVTAKNDDISLDWNYKYLEGPYAFHQDGMYYLFFAGLRKDGAKEMNFSAKGDYEYWSGVAYAHSPMGPFIKAKTGLAFWGGHLAVFDAPDGRYWFSYRGEKLMDTRGFLCIDPFRIDSSTKRLRFGDPTDIRQVVSTQPSHDFQKIVLDAIAAGERKIQIPKGTYYLDLENGAPLTLEGLHDISIDAGGSQVICKRPSQAIQITNCKNLTLSGFSIDYDPLPFTEGRIIDEDPVKHMWMTVRIYDGYPAEGIAGELPDRFQVFDSSTHQLRKNLFTYWRGDFNKVTKIADRTFTFYKSRFIPEASERMGDDIVFSVGAAGKVRPHGIVLSGCDHITLRDITLYASNCFGFFEDQCSADRYLRCVIMRKKDDPLVGYPRLRSVNADALHSKGAKVGPLIESCTLEYHGDDGIAINSSFYPVAGSDGKKVYVLQGEGKLKMREGDKVRFIDKKGGVTGERVIVSMQATERYDTGLVRKAMGLYYKRGNKLVKVVVIELDRDLSISEGALVSSLDMAGAGFMIRNSKVGFTRARGILVKASDGIIRNNLIEGCELAGIVLAPEISWMEAGFSGNVKIEGNTVRDCMFANSSYGIEQAAPISVVAVNIAGELAPAGGFQHIEIANNIIENSPLPAIMVTSAKDVSVHDNVVVRSREIVRTHGKSIGVMNSIPIWMGDTVGVSLWNNVMR